MSERTITRALTRADTREAYGVALYDFRATNGRDPQSEAEVIVWLSITGQAQRRQLAGFRADRDRRAHACVMGEGRGI